VKLGKDITDAGKLLSATTSFDSLKMIMLKKRKKSVKVSEPTVQPKYDYSDKTIHELHSVINAGLLYGQEAATKMENKARPLADDNRMIQTMRTMTQAYVRLANKDFYDENNGENFETLEDVKIISTVKFQHVSSSDANTTVMMKIRVMVTMRMGIIRKISVTILNKHAQATTINNNIR
jgi:hypothetical protein